MVCFGVDFLRNNLTLKKKIQKKSQEEYEARNPRLWSLKPYRKGNVTMSDCSF